MNKIILLTIFFISILAIEFFIFRNKFYESFDLSCKCPSKNCFKLNKNFKGFNYTNYFYKKDNQFFYFSDSISRKINDKLVLKKKQTLNCECKPGITCNFENGTGSYICNIPDEQKSIEIDISQENKSKCVYTTTPMPTTTYTPYFTNVRFLPNYKDIKRNKYVSVIAANKKLFAVPYGSDDNSPKNTPSKVLEIDTITETNRNIGDEIKSSSLGPQPRKYLISILANNGKIYCIPHTYMKKVVEIDTKTSTVKTIDGGNNFGHFGSLQMFKTAVLANNGKIYAVPYNINRKQVLEIDPVTDPDNATLDLIGEEYSDNYKYETSVLANNGKIYCAPYSSEKVLEIDPNKRTTRRIGDSYIGHAKYKSSALANNGKIYAIPYNKNKVLEINPNNGTTKLIGEKFSGYGTCVLAKNGKIYAPPLSFHAKQVLEIDPVTDPDNPTINFIGSDKIERYLTSVLANNGKIYAFPTVGTRVLEIDPYKQTSSLIGPIINQNETNIDYKYRTAVLANNGNIYAVPYDTSKIIVVEFLTQPKITTTKKPINTTPLSLEPFYPDKCPSTLSHIVVPNGTISIPANKYSKNKYGFKQCDFINKITLNTDGTLKEIGDFAFESLSKCVGTLIIPSSVTKIGFESFSNIGWKDTTSYNKLIFQKNGSEDLTIGEEAFRGFRKCNHVLELPKRTKKIKKGAFSGTKFTGIIFEKGIKLTEIDEFSFEKLSFTTDLIIPKSVTIIKKNAFYFSKMMNVKFEEGSNIKTIGNQAFAYCKELRTIEIPESVTTIGTDVFKRCYKLEGVIVPGNTPLDATSLSRLVASLRSLRNRGPKIGAYIDVLITKTCILGSGERAKSIIEHSSNTDKYLTLCN